LRQQGSDVHPSFFSMGGLLARCWRTKSPITPWICASSVLASGAVWDAVRTGGPIDFIMLGLAGYELVIGLTEEPASRLLVTVGDRDLERPPDPAC
jgi:hypothetical protein